MPEYTMIHKETGDTVTLHLSLTEREDWLKEDPNWKQKLNTPGFVSQVGSNLSKTDGGWKEVLGRVKKGSGRTNTINT